MKQSVLKKILCALLILDALLACGILVIRFGSIKAPVQTVTPAQLAATEVPQTTQAPQTQPAGTVPAETETVQTLPPETQIQEERYNLTFIGDCTLGASPGVYYAQLGFVKTVGDDLEYPFRNVVSYLENDDFTLANLECVLADRGNPVPKAFNFRGPAAFAEILTLGSVEAVNLANNHTQDYGPKGYASTLEALDGVGVPYVEHKNIRLVTTERGLVIGLYGITYADMLESDIVAGVTQLKEAGAQLIIVAAHWGVEGDYQPSYKQETLGRAAIDAGAHIVYGTHPHVLQPIEAYNGGVIYYSLGNFAFGGNGAPDDYDTAIIQQEVIVRSDGTVTMGERTIIPTCLSSNPNYNNFQPTPYEQGSEEYNRVLSKLDGSFAG